ncbi:LysR family transcriptional regulator [Pseudomonas sp. Leaf58]|uniref:LysR family transcriptional regulator n=1 Tax=Pseudomonas TaxID=286 RepID=UPI0006FE7578|nr:LysR family transcriptional regulator [Pseudomonas sp. Leaf58]AYG45174.1 LysR family transcriptional regulator [Pseudomonas sp. Leaf58]KQN59282.1 LysR family transcriptional regulator [Pseudomonas sp. Leaf58]
MDIQNLESLISVVDCGSIAGAAKKANISATAVSLRIRKMEKHLGCTLFNRDAHSIKPSEKLLAVIPRIRCIVEHAHQLSNDLNADTLIGELRIGAISTALTGLVPAALEQLSSSAPGLKLTITPGDSKLLYDKLVNQELDAAILVAPPFKTEKSLRMVTLRSEPLCLLAPAAVTQDEAHSMLATGPYIRYAARSWGGLITQRYLDDLSLAPCVTCDLDALEAISLLVSQGQGVSLVPQWPSLLQQSPNAHILTNDPKYCRDIVLAHHAGHHRASAIKLLASVLMT